MLRFRSLQEWFSSLPVFILLLAVVIAGNTEQIHTRLLHVGEYFWHDYFLLRADIPTPDCNPHFDIEAELIKLEAEAGHQDELEALFESEPFDQNAARKSLQTNQKNCADKHQLAEQNQLRITASVIVFRTLETSIALFSLYAFEMQRLILLLMLFISAITCTARQQHISFKPIITLQDHYVSTVAQCFANSCLLLSAWFYRQSIYQSATVVEHAEVYLVLIAGFTLLIVLNVYQLIKTKTVFKEGGRFLHALLAIPLYVFMTAFAANYFFIIEGHWAGLAIFFSLLIDQAGLFLNIGLYIWVGMLLKRTQLGELVFNIFIPWRLSAELLAVAAIIVMALPTAYTGASGIIIIAMGSIVYEQLINAGARRQMALATTAMTGSAGVVLRPCLLVVLIAALNKEVVTDQLFDWGLNTFITTIAVFLLFVCLTKREKIQIAPLNEAFKPFIKALLPLIPYLSIVLLTLLIYDYCLEVSMDEFSAPIILPVIILCLIVYEARPYFGVQEQIKDESNFSFEYTIRNASSEASVHTGALLMLMALSFVLGGVIERSGILSHIPDTFSSVWATLAFLVVVLIGIGMIMDPFGAVVLVTGTLAQIAYTNGINPVHFWMIALVSFELGYLTPPVALNHLLTRQMIGYEEAEKAALEGNNFWYRHEKILLPMVTMGTTLVLVAVIPVLIK
jgi:TRAP-type C4-dicarboxylate transport system permease large subunit